MKVLVTGGAGYIGSHTTVDLLMKGHDVIVVDNLSNSTVASIERIKKITHKNIEFYEGDISNVKIVTEIINKHKIECIVHFAGAKSVSESVSHPLHYYNNNVSGTLTLIECALKNNIKHFIFSSSATVYGTPEIIPLTENCSIGGTTNPYGTSKYISELMLRDIAKVNANINIICLRYFNPTGAHISGMIGESPKGIPNNLVPYLSQVAIGKRKTLSIFGGDYPTPDGTGVRDYIHVMDLAEGHVAVIDYLEKSKQQANFEVFNLGTGKGYSVLELVKTFETVSRIKITFEIISRREGDIAECWSNPKLANDRLNWRASRDLETMLKDSWRWQTNNPNGYE